MIISIVSSLIDAVNNAQLASIGRPLEPGCYINLSKITPCKCNRGSRKMLHFKICWPNGEVSRNWRIAADDLLDGFVDVHGIKHVPSGILATSEECPNLKPLQLLSQYWVHVREVESAPVKRKDDTVVLKSVYNITID